MDKTLQLADISIDEDILDEFGVDLIGVFPQTPDKWQNIVYADGSFKDEWEMVSRMPENG